MLISMPQAMSLMTGFFQAICFSSRCGTATRSACSRCRWPHNATKVSILPVADLEAARGARASPSMHVCPPPVARAKDLSNLRRALAEAMANPDLAGTSDTLSLRGICPLGDAWRS